MEPGKTGRPVRSRSRDERFPFSSNAVFLRVLPNEQLFGAPESDAGAFSNSPDPDAYYRTPTHEDCLNRLEIAIRLRRGLNVVLGEVGTGKSTLCRCLLRSLNEQSGIDVFLLLDAGFEDADEFVRHLCELFAGQRPPEGVARRECISVIQNRVFDKALEQNRNLVLFIDEGQKLSPAALEVLRELLNFETNTEKLLQIVILVSRNWHRSLKVCPILKIGSTSTCI